mmetsp:Transcript_9626/g.33850  ORF Transcript_9626/g.33850 Transcript_9626/m.33850 type:complete len:297 (+) Transcript_9626:345-1235(+)
MLQPRLRRRPQQAAVQLERRAVPGSRVVGAVLCARQRRRLPRGVGEEADGVHARGGSLGGGQGGAEAQARRRQAQLQAQQRRRRPVQRRDGVGAGGPERRAEGAHGRAQGGLLQAQEGADAGRVPRAARVPLRRRARPQRDDGGAALQGGRAGQGLLRLGDAHVGARGRRARAAAEEAAGRRVEAARQAEQGRDRQVPQGYAGPVRHPPAARCRVAPPRRLRHLLRARRRRPHGQADRVVQDAHGRRVPHARPARRGRGGWLRAPGEARRCCAHAPDDARHRRDDHPVRPHRVSVQ